MKAEIQITKFSGEILKQINYNSEYSAQDSMDSMIKRKIEFEGKLHSISEYYSSLCIGFLKLIAVSDKGERFLRREFYIYA